MNPLTKTYNSVFDLEENVINGQVGELIVGMDSMIYGVAGSSSSQYQGGIFRFDPVIKELKTLFKFTDSTKTIAPIARLLQVSDTLMLGVTMGGLQKKSSLYSFNVRTNKLEVLHEFDSLPTQYFPLVNVIKHSNGLFYGTTYRGGIHGQGIIYSFDLLSNQFSKLHDFNQSEGGEPYSELIELDSGKLYGTVEQSYVNNFNAAGGIFEYDVTRDQYVMRRYFQEDSIWQGFTRNGLLKTNASRLFGTTGTQVFEFIGNRIIPTTKYNWDFTGAYPGELVELNNCDILGMQNTIYKDSLGELIANSEFTQFQWYKCSTDSILIGEISAKLSLSDSGSYAVIVTKYGCVDTSNCILHSTVGLTENPFQSQLNYYPNPTNGLVQIEFKQVQQNVAFEVYSIQGKLVQTQQFTNGERFGINLNQPAGIYFIQLINENGERANLKVVKR